MKHLGSAILWLALWLGAWAGVRAEPAAQVAPEVEISAVLHGPVPFHQGELHDALLPRLGDASIDTRAAARGAVVEVSAAAGGVLVRVGARERTLSLGERTGPGAARVVALVILDLLLSEGPALPMPLAPPPAAEPVEILDEPAGAPAAHAAAAPAATAPPTRPKSLAFEPPPPPPPPVRAAAPADVAPPRLAPPGVAARPAPPGVAARPAPEAPARPASRLEPSARAVPTRTVAHVRLSGFGGTTLGAASGDATMFSAGADARLGLGSWRAGVGVSWLHLPALSYAQTDIGMNGAAVRLDAGRALGGVELTAAAFAMPSRLYTDTSDSPREHRDSLLFGGGAAMRAGARLGHGWRLVATVGVDVYGRRLRVRTPDAVITSTPTVAISLAFGVSWEVMP